MGPSGCRNGLRGCCSPLPFECLVANFLTPLALLSVAQVLPGNPLPTLCRAQLGATLIRGSMSSSYQTVRTCRVHCLHFAAVCP